MLKEIFSQQSNIQSKTVHNAIITLGDTDDSGKGRHFKSRFIQPGIAGYPGQFGNVLIKKESLDRFIDTMVGVPVIINHKDLNKDNADDERVGVVNSVWYDDKDGWYWCDGIIWNETAQNLITDKKWSVSCSYDVKTANDEGGSENNIQYDMEFLDGAFTHLALVDNPRYERANIVFNAKDKDSEEGRWITIKGTHVFIKKGQSLTEAMRERGMEVKQKYKQEGVKWDEEQLRKDISETRTDGLEEIEDIADYLGLDEDEVRETLAGQETYTELIKKLDEYKRRALEGDSSVFVKQIIEGLQQKIDDMRTNPSNYINGRLKQAKINETNNSKEQDMALLDELKKLITKVENNKGEDMDNKEKIENDKVDKRKLIDEVAGIMKSAGCDDELIRTAIGKMEKMSYDKSEAGTADNEKEDDKAENCGKKVKNEDKEDEESKEKVDELEDDEKNDAENKCKNSVDNSKTDYFAKLNEIYNASSQTKSEPSYVSRADREKAAEDYFAR